ncbi:BlaI/MecI/CopY family transcriptional regulator [Streptomyces sp. NPDC048419]|uniref:BlaI/MecI/CopY family transcriptional regulator n=1 Tax=Streptomyces sp. NPDC048419 TaxID=3365547 RepID=UPI00371E2F9B
MVQERLSGDTAYTTVLTILTRLRDMGLVTRRKEGRGHLHARVHDQPGLAAAGMHALLDEGGDRGAVPARFVSDLSAEDERMLERMLHGDDPGRT